MDKIGIFFATDSGTTRLIAKKIMRRLGEDIAAAPLNINRTSLEDFLACDVYVLGTPTYGDGQLPGLDSGLKAASWLDFVPQLTPGSMTGKTVALYGVGNQEKYGDHFINGLRALYDILQSAGADIVGSWPTEGYTYSASTAVIDGRFVGLAIDNKSQPLLTEQRLNDWLDLIKPALMKAVQIAA